jgi:hypothetical protein
LSEVPGATEFAVAGVESVISVPLAAMDTIVVGGISGTPTPVTIMPVERPAVESIPVIVVEPVAVVPLLSVKVSGTALPRPPTAGATAALESVTVVAVMGNCIVVFAGIPAPLMVVPTFKFTVEGTVTVVDPSVTVPLVSENVSEAAAFVTDGSAERVMSVPLTTVAIVVPAGIPNPLTAVPGIKPAVEARVTVVETFDIAPGTVVVVLVAVTV